MKITNADVNACLADMTHVTTGGNRLDSLPALRAVRIREALAAAWKSVDEHRLQLAQDHGKLNELGTHYVFETGPAVTAYNDGWEKALAEVRDIEIETLTLAEVQAGWFRTPEGKRERFDISPDSLARLIRVGIVTEAS